MGCVSSPPRAAPSPALTPTSTSPALLLPSCSTAYPWYTSVRTILEDPAYSDWFSSFKPGGSKPGGGWYSDPCDANNRTYCSDRYHNQEQSPAYPSGDGDCDAPTCDCGKVPCGFYFFNHSSTTVVNGQTFGAWFKDTYIFDAQGTSPLVSGFYFDVR